ncbi:hypothetical protein ALC57_09048 [Trachymyrmex cornetzi]|uniref:Uncharacterized protein n=1 Tax=Trachymyrmex cornetzi TaxID=471704 RepID=A0A151J649_9HYME|nr:hypothetical protein ALC57_09048 [Trachymyrmex cornetzi]
MFFINSFMHTIMYMYYLSAAWGPNVRKAVAPMKRWITIMQMVNSPDFLSHFSRRLFSFKSFFSSNYFTYLTNNLITIIFETR